MYDTILVPTDGSDHAVRAAEHALYLAETFDAAIETLTVVAGDGDAADDADRAATRDDGGQAALAAIEDAIGSAERLSASTVSGDPAEAILDYAASNEVDLIAMGTHGRTGVRRYVWGSVAERVLRRAEVPVSTVRATDRSRLADGYDDVLVPTDGSASATAAADHALAIAAAAGARVHALTVVDVGDAATSPSVTPPSELLRGLESEGERATEDVASRGRDRGVDVVTEVREGDPSKDALAYAEANDVDLVVLGTQGRTGLDRYVVGSTTERVVRHAEMPVVSVTADQSDD